MVVLAGQIRLLVLTDRMSEGQRLQQTLSAVAPCTLAALHHPTNQRDDHILVVCDVALDTVAAVDMLRAALLHIGLHPGIAVLCLLRDPSHLTEAQAKAAGATMTLPRQASPDALRAVVRSLLQAGAERAPAPRAKPAPIDAGVKAAGSILGNILGQRAGPETITVAALDRASGVLLGAIGQAGVQAWLDVVWTYDDATYQHCMMVAGLTAAFALELGLQPRSQNLLSQAALLHDIGKAQIPRGILNKAGPLTSTEALLMRSHPMRGYAMLAGKRDLDPCILDVVRHHHELLDGSGYPDRLRTDQVSRMVRMVTICDIYSALIEHRPYKTPSSPRDALAYLDSLGPRLDHRLVSAFRNVVRDR